MIIDFSFENFKSFKTHQHFSMEASATRVKEGNTFELTLGDGNRLRLLKSVALFGPNAHGKTSFLEAIASLFTLITTSSNQKIGDPIPEYNPYGLDLSTDSMPTMFKLNFVGPKNLKYTYEIKFDQKSILSEKLDFYPFGKAANLFERESGEKGIDIVKLGKSLKGKRIDKASFSNQLYLSKFGSSQPHEQLSSIYEYFTKGKYLFANDIVEAQEQIREIAQKIARSSDDSLQNEINRLMSSADTNINSFSVKETKLPKLPDYIPEEDRIAILDRIKFRVLTQHNRYKNGVLIDTIDFDLLRDESHGTKALFSTGGSILEHMNSAGPMFIDEIDSGLHPDLTARIVDLFHDENINHSNAQFIFSTHTTSVIEKSRMRSDQIWMVEKNERGESELYSAQDFEEVREDIPFDKWYRAGKFGAIPRFSTFSISRDGSK